MTVPNLLLLLTPGVAWGLSFSLLKILSDFGVHPLALTLGNALLGGLLLFLWCLARGRPPPWSRNHLVFYVVAGLLGSAVPSASLLFAAPHLPAGILAIEIGMVPLITYFLVLILRVEGFHARRFLGLALGFAVIAALVGPDEGLGDPAAVVWVLVALIAPASYALEDVYIALRRPAGGDSAALVCGMLLASSAFLGVVVVAGGTWETLLPRWPELLPWMVAATVVSLSAYVLFLELLRRAGAVYASQVGYVVTGAGVVWGILLFDEQHSGWVWVALAILFVSLALVGGGKKKG